MLSKYSMRNHKIEELRRMLNEMVISENIDKEELLRVSKALDVLIVQVMHSKENSRIVKANVRGRKGNNISSIATML